MNFIEKNTKKVAVILGLVTAVSAISTVYATQTSDGWHGSGANRVFRDDGKPKVNAWVYQPEGTYYVDANGHPVISQWKTINDSVYYFDKDGKKVSGKQYIDGYAYTFQKSGVLLTGWNKEKTMYYTSYGEAVTGVQNINDRTYNFDENGKLQRGWITFGNKTVYFTDEGVFASGEVLIDGQKYNFTSDGTIINGWKTIDGEIFYYDEFGYMSKGWKTIDSKKYYFNKKGQAATNTEYEGYTFDKNGVAEKIVKKQIKSATSTKYPNSIGDSSKGKAAATIASSQIGRAYVLGGTTPAGFDCSGLTSYAYAQVGISIPRTAGEQGTIGSAVAYGDMIPGDLIVWNYGAHVGIYTGNGMMTHSANPSTGVLSSSVSYWSANSGQTITAIRRP